MKHEVSYDKVQVCILSSKSDSTANDKIMKTGLKVFKDLGLDPKKIQRDIIKKAILKELKL